MEDTLMQLIKKRDLEVLTGKPSMSPKWDMATMKYDSRLHQQRYGLQIKEGDTSPPL